VISRSRDGRRRSDALVSSFRYGAVDNDLTCTDHGLGLTTGPRQPTLDQLAIEPLGHCLAGLGSAGIARSVLISSVKRLPEHLVYFGKPIVMLAKWSRSQVRELTKSVVDGRVLGLGRRGRRLRTLELIGVRLGHV
jgi:hypothetical protein